MALGGKIYALGGFGYCTTEDGEEASLPGFLASVRALDGPTGFGRVE